MKKTILIFGLLSGLIASSMLIVSAVQCYNNKDFSGNMVMGFTLMILAFSFIFVGVKNYRDKFNQGVISFGKAFKIGILIAFIASSIYVITWLIAYYGFIPDFMDKYAAHVIEQARAAGKTTVEINKQIAEMEDYKEMYKTPIGVVLLTYMEILPIGIVITLLSALILKRKQNTPINVA
jgi:ethanolamine transporter EutH